jgi:predicted Ser/Thr protein kinase
MENSPEPLIPLTAQHPYQRLLSYPDNNTAQQAHYCQQLHQLGVEGLVATGSAQLGGLPLLGVGYCGLVIAGVWHGRAVAIKLRRSSCQQNNLNEEARLLSQANLLHIGPRLYCHHGDILVMKRLNGSTFANWLQNLRAEDSPKLRRIIQKLLWQGYHLDSAGIDHGALRCVAEHVFIADERLTIIDFSHSSDKRRPNNVTSLVSGLLWGTQLAQDVRRLLLLPERDTLLPLLQNYKQQPQHCHLQALLSALGLDEQEPETVP